MIITTSQRTSEETKLEAQRIAKKFDLSYIARDKRSLQKLLTISAPVAVLSSDTLTIHFNEHQTHSFHLSMAQLRLLRLEEHGEDYLVSAVNQLIHKVGNTGSSSQSEHRLSILDCTLGLGSDSIVLSYAFPAAEIESIEGSFPIWLSTTYGLRHFQHHNKLITDALRRIQTTYGDFRTVLDSKEENSIDIIYIDPMFERPIDESPQFKPLRGNTVESSLTEAVLTQAKTVARLGIIIKERPFSSIFKRYPPDAWVGGKYSRIVYALYYV